MLFFILFTITDIQLLLHKIGTKSAMKPVFDGESNTGFFMEMKHVIIFAVIGIVALLGFNIINGNSREKNREVAVSTVATDSATDSATDADSTQDNAAAITSKPLGEQPKAMLDDATNKINQAQQSEQDRLDQMNNTQ